MHTTARSNNHFSLVSQSQRDNMSNNKLFVSNISFKTTETELADFFAQSGSVVKAHIATDRQTGQQRGFAFVEMSTAQEADSAIKELNGQNLGGRDVSVVISQPKPRAFGY
jgi:cold-inducible RNA-binding protein